MVAAGGVVVIEELLEQIQGHLRDALDVVAERVRAVEPGARHAVAVVLARREIRALTNTAAAEERMN